MVHFSACRAVLLPFLGLVVEPALLAPGLEVVSCSVLFYYVLCYIFVLFCLLPHFTVGFAR